MQDESPRGVLQDPNGKDKNDRAQRPAHNAKFVTEFRNTGERGIEFFIAPRREDRRLETDDAKYLKQNERDKPLQRKLAEPFARPPRDVIEFEAGGGEQKCGKRDDEQSQG